MEPFFREKKKRQKEQLVEEILLKEYDRYFRLAYSYVGNGDDAGDIVQEGAYKAIYHSDSLKKTEYAGTWIYRIMLNEIFAFCRNRTEKSIDMGKIPEQGAEDKYQNVDLMRALEKLEEKDRAVIVLRYFEDYKLGEIAEVLEENVSTVKSRLYRSIKKLKMRLDNDWIWEEA